MLAWVALFHQNFYMQFYQVEKRNNKYGAIKTEYNGRTFDSKKEAGYAEALDFCRKAKDPKDRVVDIEYQPPFKCVVNGKKICTYKADFRVKYADGREEVVDVKGKKTAVYSLKKKLVEALFDVEIKEV